LTSRKSSCGVTATARSAHLASFQVRPGPAPLPPLQAYKNPQPPPAWHASEGCIGEGLVSKTIPLGEDVTPCVPAASSPAPVDVVALAARVAALEAELQAERAAKTAARSPSSESAVDPSSSQAPPRKTAGKPLPPFKPWRVASLIEVRLKKLDQHVAYALARHTPQNGTLPLTWRELETWTGWTGSALRKAAARIKKTGLIDWTGDHQGIVLTWTPAAYETPPVGATQSKRNTNPFARLGVLGSLSRGRRLASPSQPGEARLIPPPRRDRCAISPSVELFGALASPTVGHPPHAPRVRFASAPRTAALGTFRPTTTNFDAAVLEQLGTKRRERRAVQTDRRSRPAIDDPARPFLLKSLAARACQDGKAVNVCS
jgi:hypothetical protein